MRDLRTLLIPGVICAGTERSLLLASPSSLNPVLIHLYHAAIAIPNVRTMRWSLQRCWSFMCLRSIGFSYLRESRAPARPSLGRCHSASAPAESRRRPVDARLRSCCPDEGMGSVVRCRSSLRSKSLRKVSIGTPSALLQVALQTSVCSDRQPETAKSGVT